MSPSITHRVRGQPGILETLSQTQTTAQTTQRQEPSAAGPSLPERKQQAGEVPRTASGELGGLRSLPSGWVRKATHSARSDGIWAQAICLVWEEAWGEGWATCEVLYQPSGPALPGPHHSCEYTGLPLETQGHSPFPASLKWHWKGTLRKPLFTAGNTHPGQRLESKCRAEPALPFLDASLEETFAEPGGDGKPRKEGSQFNAKHSVSPQAWRLTSPHSF